MKKIKYRMYMLQKKQKQNIKKYHVMVIQAIKVVLNLINNTFYKFFFYV